MTKDSFSKGRKKHKAILWFGAFGITMVLAAATSYVVVQRVIEPELSGDSASGEAGSEYASELNLQEFKDFEEFNIYWLGESFRGLALTAMYETFDSGIRGYEDTTSNPIVILVYGKCEIPLGQTGCPAPLGINIQPYCARPPEIIHNRVKTGPPADIRGAIVQWTGDDAILWTNDVAISVTGTDRTVIEEAVRNLIAVTPGGPKSASEDLGPPLEVTCPSLPYATGQPVEDAELEP